MHIVLHFCFLSQLLFKLYVLWNSSLSFAIFFFFSFAEPNIEVSAQGNFLYIRDVNKSFLGCWKKFWCIHDDHHLLTQKFTCVHKLRRQIMRFSTLPPTQINNLNYSDCHVLHSLAEYFKGQCSAGLGDICESVGIESGSSLGSNWGWK